MTEKHSYEIIVLDLDGTLTNTEKKVTEPELPIFRILRIIFWQNMEKWGQTAISMSQYVSMEQRRYLQKRKQRKEVCRP